MASSNTSLANQAGDRVFVFFQSLVFFVQNTLQQALGLSVNFRKRPGEAEEKPGTGDGKLAERQEPIASTREQQTVGQDGSETDIERMAPSNAGPGEKLETVEAPKTVSALPKVIPALPRFPPPPLKKSADTTGSNDSATSKETPAIGAIAQGMAALMKEKPPSDKNVVVADSKPKKLGRDKNSPLALGKENNPAMVGKREETGGVSLSAIADVESGEVAIQSQMLSAPQMELQYPPEERAMHELFMNEALDMARLALKTNETPVGCVFVWRGRVIARGMNATNTTRNGTRHAELMALNALFSFNKSEIGKEPVRKSLKNAKSKNRKTAKEQANQSVHALESDLDWEGVNPTDGHLFPYGQKLHPLPRVDKSIVRECTLYVTVEPCVMCASLLRQLHVKKVFFGAVNDKFGGTGGVFRIHQNSTPNQPKTAATTPPSPAPQQRQGLQRPAVPARAVSAVDNHSNGGADSSSHFVDLRDSEASYAKAKSGTEGDGGNVEPGYEAEGGWGRNEAVTLLRQFYVQENGRAPVPRKKEGRAARLAAMMERDGHAGGRMISANTFTGPAGASTTSLDSVADGSAETPAETVEEA